MSYYSIMTMTTTKEDLHKVAKSYGWARSYKSSTVKMMDEYLEKVADRLAYVIRIEGIGYGWEMAQRNEVRYILLPRVEDWLTARAKLSGRGQLEQFRRLIQMEFKWIGKKLDEVCAYIREHGLNAELPMVYDEVKYYERVCLYAYAMSQVAPVKPLKRATKERGSTKTLD